SSGFGALIDERPSSLLQSRRSLIFYHEAPRKAQITLPLCSVRHSEFMFLNGGLFIYKSIKTGNKNAASAEAA
ncbi:MAG: hypothetical protein ABJH96_18105, partial [Algoriphagus sp.]|uniref:hypothetical protein n=1 Tax=Algoriphagus sp. TaxID=1872435 RepID=UPI0032983B73